MPRHDTEVLSRRAEVARRYLQGEMQEQIAQSFGVTQGQISQDLKAIRAAWLASAVRDFDALKAQELAKIDAVEREYWLAWERSKKDKEIAVAGAELELKTHDGRPGHVDQKPPCSIFKANLGGGVFHIIDSSSGSGAGLSSFYGQHCACD
jgi:transcriptional regulator with XRE-family HTH domain